MTRKRSREIGKERTMELDERLWVGTKTASY
jgi:hypothetical protein